MIHEEPDALALLAIARETLLEHVLPQVDGGARYQALMVANAIAIALRELGPENVHRASETRQLRDLYARCVTPAGAGAHDDPAVLETRFAQDLRRGTFDGQAQQHAVRELLRLRTEARLAVSNPRRLDRDREARAPAAERPARAVDFAEQSATDRRPGRADRAKDMD